MSNQTRQDQTIYKMFNPAARRWEEIETDLAELFPGDRVVKMFWCESARRYVTIPGASLYEVTAQGLALVG